MEDELYLLLSTACDVDFGTLCLLPNRMDDNVELIS